MLAVFLASVAAFLPSKPLRSCPARRLWSCSGCNKPLYDFIIFHHNEIVFVSRKANICKRSEDNAAGDEHRLALVRVLLGEEKERAAVGKGPCQSRRWCSRRGKRDMVTPFFILI